jgi:hypothetical protein
MVRRMMSSKPRRLLKWIFRLLLIAVLGPALYIGGWIAWTYHGPASEREIYHGLFYGCERLPEGPESGGLWHYVRADMNVPGVGIYITPRDPDAIAAGFEYKLKYVTTAVDDEKLAAAINGVRFGARNRYLQFPGTYATGFETVITEHEMSHFNADTYLMWWDDAMQAHLEWRKPPAEADIKAAKWAIGAQEAILSLKEHTQDRGADQQTFIAADPDRNWVWIGCFDKASYTFMYEFLQRRGVKLLIAVDGGSSKCLVVGSKAKNIRPGTITGNWRPVATQFGFRADPLP